MLMDNWIKDGGGTKLSRILFTYRGFRTSSIQYKVPVLQSCCGQSNPDTLQKRPSPIRVMNGDIPSEDLLLSAWLTGSLQSYRVSTRSRKWETQKSRAVIITGQRRLGDYSFRKAAASVCEGSCLCHRCLGETQTCPPTSHHAAEETCSQGGRAWKYSLYSTFLYLSRRGPPL